ncbi:magnesium/cobalt transporter CorA [Schlesneria sp. T3-172]|uniref:magnesium/cobalt transporter CorA n=1 Tax=Schlesneria TaxID=656899 RepID=UPI002F23536F
MFRVLEVTAEGQVSVTEGIDKVGPPPPGVLRWIDLEKQDEAQLGVLAQRFHFHPLTIEDCSHFDQRPKMEEYGDYLFLVTHGFRLTDSISEPLDTLELHTFLNRDYIVTVHVEHIAPLETVWCRLKGDGALFKRGADFVSYLVADAIVDGFFPLLDDVAAQVEEVEDQVLGGSHKVEMADIFRLKRLLVELRKVLSPQRDVFALLAKRGDGRIGSSTALYFRDVYDHVLRIHERVEGTRDLLGNALDAYLWSASQRTNEIMKRLTLLSAIFMPLSFITGFWGQNFEGLPTKSNSMMNFMLVSCAVIPLGMIYYFRRSKWF